ncbi:histidine kinase [Arthrobacter sp. ISL-69]|uniref:sensor histidine kinase n=1 Tax=Arthrobacter sp. ISL-69 TaxID=2819113 RepID=UPI00288A0A93|nr:histidine kinase [Arthrobacter sp. ISL-69]
MTPKQLILIVAATVGVLALVLISIDWRPAALQDPARTLGVLNAQGVIRWGENPDRPPFSVLELSLFIAVGLAFVLAGVTAWQTRPNRNPGLLLVVAGLLWLAAGVRRSSDPVLFTVGVGLTLMYQPPLLQLALSFPSGVLRSRVERAAVIFFFAAWAVVAAASWAFFDPRLHIAAGQSTSRNLLLMWDSPQLTNTIGDAARIVQVGVGLAIVAVLVSRWRSGSPAYRAAFLPLWLAVIIKTASTVWVSLAVVQLTGSLSNEALLWQYPATAIVPLAVLLGLWRYRFARGALGDLMVEIGMAPVSDRLIRALRRSVRDPTLSLWRWSPSLSGFVDDDGVPRAVPEDGSGRAAMVLERNGTPVGALVFDEALRDQPQLLAAVRSATSLALDNQNMEQQLRDQLVEVRRSRERIVTAGDARRRELERDLHDGAQQRLVAVSMDLARARRAASPVEMKELVDHASDVLAVALAELRELARGVYPPSLRERGLAGSLTALAERSALPIQLEVDLPQRPPPQVELAAYFICAEAVTNAAKHSRASTLLIGVEGTETEIGLRITDNGIGGASAGADGGLLGLADRAAALGGSLAVTSPEGRGTTVAATLPFLADPTEDMP